MKNKLWGLQLQIPYLLHLVTFPAHLLFLSQWNTKQHHIKSTVFLVTWLFTGGLRWCSVLQRANCAKIYFSLSLFFFLRMRRIYRDFFFPSRVAVWEHFILFCLNLNLLVRVQLWYRTHSSPFQKLKTNRKLMPKWDMIQSLFNFMVGCG